MIVFITQEERDEQRKKHETLTYCKRCFSCQTPCGKTSIVKYRKYLKDNNLPDPWDTDEKEDDVTSDD